MTKIILVTGSTDGIGLEAAKLLAAAGHHLLLHGRNSEKLEQARAKIGGTTEGYLADFSDLLEVERLAQEVLARHQKIDVLINNAGVLKTPHTRTKDGLDLRFVVNTLAPYLLTRQLLPAIPKSGRVVNLSSAAQAPVNLAAMKGEAQMADMEAYAQSKLAITMWSRALATELPDGPVFVSVNPGSLLGTKMVREGFGTSGNDIGIGADILRRAAVSDEFKNASGQYFDNDLGRFGSPHPAALNLAGAQKVTTEIDILLKKLLPAA